MKIDRRSLLKNGAVAGGIVVAPAAVHAYEAPALTIFDSRALASRAFAHGQRGAKIDVAQEDAQLWRSLRNANKGRVEGLTSWSDWVLVRGLLEERGLRVKTENAKRAHCSAGPWLERKHIIMSDARSCKQYAPGLCASESLVI